MTTMLLLNGGVGKRIGADVPKQFIRLNNIPTFIYSLRIADELDTIDHVIMNYPEGWQTDIETLVKKYAIRTPITYVPAGRDRQDSVRLLVAEAKSPSVIVHEAARPLVTAAEFQNLIDRAEQNIAYTLPLSFTVLKRKKDANFVGKVLKRERLINIQLPQKFDRETLQAAHDLAVSKNRKYTEDAALVFEYGVDVKTILGSDKNIKITTPLDIHVASLLLNNPWNTSFDIS